MELNNDTLRVAMVAPSLRILGGQSIQADRLLRAWADNGQVQTWLVPHNPLPPAPFRWATRVKYLRTLVTEATYIPLLFADLRRADVVHVFSASYSSFLLSPLPAIIVARLLRKPIVLNYHSGEAPDHLRRSAVARLVLGRVEHIAVPSRYLRDVFAHFGLPATVVPNLATPHPFTYRPREPLRPRLLSTRNLEPLYNVACTLRAFRLVQERWPDASLTVVGSGSERARLLELASSLGLRHVTFTGRVAPAEMERYYASHDIYLQSPDIDNMPLSVLEAFASGLPVVSTEAGGVPAILTHGRHGLLAPSGDAETLARHVLDLLDDPANARALAEAAHATLDAYSWPVVRDRWLAVYRSVLARQAGTTEAVRA